MNIEKFVFVVAGVLPGSPQIRMLATAACSVRLFNSHAMVIVVTDEISTTAVEALREKFPDIFCEVVEVNCPSGSAPFRSRFLKTQIGVVIDAPFIYLDIDILVRRRLTDLTSYPAALAAAQNHGISDQRLQVAPKDRRIASLLGWTAPSQYRNTGVVAFNDPHLSRDFCKHWHSAWRTSLATTGEYVDQPAFNYVVTRFDGAVKLLPQCFNCQMTTCLSGVEDAAIWHFYTSRLSGPNASMKLSRLISADLPETQQALFDAVSAFAAESFPWSAPDPITRFVIKYSSNKRLPNALEQNLLAWKFLRSSKHGALFLARRTAQAVLPNSWHSRIAACMNLFSGLGVR